MKTSRTIFAWALLGAGMAALIGPAAAQSAASKPTTAPAPAAPVVPSKPSSTTASFGDWTLR